MQVELIMAVKNKVGSKISWNIQQSPYVRVQFQENVWVMHMWKQTKQMSI